MNKTLMGALIALLIIVGAGLVYAVSRDADTSDTATTTPPIVQNNDDTPGISGDLTAPVVMTSSTAAPWDTTVVVTGTVNPNGTITNYWYEYGKTSSLGNKTENQTIGSGFVVIQAPSYIINLTKNTTYYFKLVAENQYGRADGNLFSFRTTEGNLPPAGGSPTVKTISASNISRTTAKINGEITPNKVATQYWFEYGKTVSLGNTTVFTSVEANVTKTPVSVSLSNLEPLTTYYFRLNAQNQFGTVIGSILNFKTAGPSSAKASKVPCMITCLKIIPSPSTEVPGSTEANWRSNAVRSIMHS